MTQFSTVSQFVSHFNPFNRRSDVLGYILLPHGYSRTCHCACIQSFDDSLIEREIVHRRRDKGMDGVVGRVNLKIENVS
jgi:hypothetical protein